MVDSLEKLQQSNLENGIELYCQLEMNNISSSYSNQSSETVKQTKKCRLADYFTTELVDKVSFYRRLHFSMVQQMISLTIVNMTVAKKILISEDHPYFYTSYSFCHSRSFHHQNASYSAMLPISVVLNNPSWALFLFIIERFPSFIIMYKCCSCVLSEVFAPNKPPLVYKLLE